MNIRTLYLLILIIEIGFSLVGNHTGILVFKPLLMPLLMVVAFQSGIKNKWVFLALFFSLLGDVFLMFNGENYFIYGLGSFLIAHLFYILAFGIRQKIQILPTLFFVIYSAIFFIIISKKLDGGLFAPVLAYCLVLTAMGIFAWHKGIASQQLFFFGIGAILFIISDSLIAYNKFVNEISLNSLWVMSTYGLAQYLILQGFIKAESDI